MIGYEAAILRYCPRTTDESTCGIERVGKKAAGRFLDGVAHVVTP